MHISPNICKMHCKIAIVQFFVFCPQYAEMLAQFSTYKTKTVQTQHKTT